MTYACAELITFVAVVVVIVVVVILVLVLVASSRPICCKNYARENEFGLHCLLFGKPINRPWCHFGFVLEQMCVGARAFVRVCVCICLLVLVYELIC